MFRLPIALPVLLLCCVTVTPHEVTPSPTALAPALANFKHSNTVDLGEIFDGRDFGITSHRGAEQPQSWCRQCRANVNYHNLPRKYRTKHNP